MFVIFVYFVFFVYKIFYSSTNLSEEQLHRKNRGSFWRPVPRSICFSSKETPSKTFVPKYHFLCCCFLFACNLNYISVVFSMFFPSIFYFITKFERKLNRVGMIFYCFLIHFGVAIEWAKLSKSTTVPSDSCVFAF